MAIAKRISLARFFFTLLFLAGLHWTNEKSETRETPFNATGKPAALEVVLVFLEATGMCLRGSVCGSCSALVLLTVVRFFP